MIDHDRLFKELITTFFAEFIELFLPDVALYLNPASLTELRQEVYSDITSGPRYVTDILMQAQFKDEETYFLIHVENQSYSESDFAERMFLYFARLHEKHKKPVYPIALFSYEEPQRLEPDFYEVAFPNKTILRFSFETIQLNRLAWQDFLLRPNPVASALMAKMKIAPQDRPRVKLECLRMLGHLPGLTPARRQMVSGFVDSYLVLDQAEAARFQEELEKIDPPEKEEVMEIMTSWKREGIQQGIQQGKVNLLRLLLSQRLGSPLGPELEERLAKLPESSLDELTLAVRDFNDTDDLTAWLDSHSA